MTEERRKQFDENYLRLAFVWSRNSRAERLKVGAIMVKDDMIISDGFNGTPRGFDNCCEIKNADGSLVSKREVLHAESNAIAKVAKSTNSSEGSTLYITDSPCFDCAKMIIQAGIKRVVYAREYRILDGINLLKDAGIEVEHLPIV